jgi:hypothetical protein
VDPQATEQRLARIGDGMRVSRIVPPCVLAVAALLAVLPLMLHGYSCGHDFDFHLRSWMEASAQWHAGILKPIWAFHAAFNTGEPRFLFYPPLSWMTGALLTTVLPWVTVSNTFTWLVLFLSGLTMYRLLRRWVSPGHAMLGGCLYLANPYMLFCAYERTAYAELMAAAWMPLLLAALLRSRVSVWRIALAVALLWITNAPAGIIGCYSVLLLGAGRLLWLWSKDRAEAWPYATRVTAGTALGLFADAFYLVPLAVERQSVQLNLAIVPNARPDANFLFSHTGDAFHDGVLLHSSTIAVVLVAAAIVCGAVALLLHTRVRTFASMDARDTVLSHPLSAFVVPVLLAYSVAVLLLQLRASAPIWHVAPELVFLQFPWRFLAMQAAVTVTLVVLCLDRVPQWIKQDNLRTPALVAVGMLFTALAGFLLADHTFREGCEDFEVLATQRAAFLHGDAYEETDEYNPVGADSDQLKVKLPAAWLSIDATGVPSPLTGEAVASTVLPVETQPHPDDLLFTATSTLATRFLIVRLRNFRGWHILRDGTELTTLPHRRDGLIVVPLPVGGVHQVEIRYHTTIDQYVGGALSIFGIVSLFGIAQQERRRVPA